MTRAPFGVAVSGALALLVCAGCGGGSSTQDASAPATTSAAQTRAAPTVRPPTPSAVAPSLALSTSSLAPATSAVTPKPSASTAIPTSTAPDVSALCIVPAEYKNVVNYHAGADTVEALEVGTGKVGIVLAHQSDQDLCEWQPYADALAKKGYRAIAFSFGDDLVADVVGAAAELRAKGATKVILVGASMGGTAVLAAAPTIKPAVAAVVDLSGPIEYDDISAISAAPDLTMPVFFVASKDDSPFVDDTQTMYDLATHSAGRKLLIRSGYEHGVDMVKGSTQQAIERFLKANS